VALALPLLNEEKIIMSVCRHQWNMTNIRFGFVVFEKCPHCNSLRTFFSTDDLPILGDKYREGRCFWSRVENAQSLQFDLQCRQCGHLEKYDDLMGLMHCTGCLPECKVDIIQRQLELERTWVMVAFGFLLGQETKPLDLRKLDILTDYFNQRRDTRIKLLSFDLIPDWSRCKGDFIHDIGMLSQEAPGERKPLLGS
jgi:hypothetical protein